MEAARSDDSPRLVDAYGRSYTSSEPSTQSVVINDGYDIAGRGRRLNDWPWTSPLPTPQPWTRQTVRARARNAYQNQSFARRAVDQLTADLVGRGIRPDVDDPAFRLWSETTKCDADGRVTFYGLQRLAARSVITGGEVLVRGRFRRASEGLPVALQLQIIEGDALDSVLDKDTGRGNVIDSGIELDRMGRRRAYWMRRDQRSFASARVPARDVAHVYRVERPGQRRGVSWLAPVLLRLGELDRYNDAALVKQKISACLALAVTDSTGDDNTAANAIAGESQLSPGAVVTVPPGEAIEAIRPPDVSEHDAFVTCCVREIAAGANCQYESLSQNYRETSFSASRMSRLAYERLLDQLRDDVFYPFLATVWEWILMAGRPGTLPVMPEWIAQRLPAADQWKEAQADIAEARAGLQTHENLLRQRGLNPTRHMATLAAERQDRQTRGLILSIDAENRTEQGYDPEPNRSGDGDGDDNAGAGAQAA